MTEHLDGLLPGFAAGTLRADEQAAVEAHLAGCARCRGESREWGLVARAVRRDVAARADGVPELDLSPVLALVAAPPKGVPDSPSTNDSPSGAFRRQPMSRGRRFPRRLLILLLLLLPAAWGLWLARDGGARWRQASGRPIVVGGSSLAPMGSPNGEADAFGKAIGAGPVEPAASAIARLRVPAALGSPTRSVTGVPAPVRVPPRVASPPPAGPSIPAATADSVLAGAAGADPGAALAPAAPAVQPPHESPAPAEAPATPQLVAGTGEIAGQVLGPDGAGRAEIRVIADPLGAGEPVAAYSEADGRYSLAVSTGRWVMHAEAPAYQLEWYPGLPSPYGAPALDVAGDDRVGGIDFALRPYPTGRVSGRVLDADGRPVERALLVALEAAGGRGIGTGPDGGCQSAAFTRDDGTYTLYLEPGEYAVGVAPDWRSPPSAWWRRATELARADPVRAGDDGAPPVDLVVR